METRIVDVEKFKVKGYALKGPLSEIPGKWDVLNAEIAKQGVVAEESFGLCLSMKDGDIHYIAGIKSHLAEGFPDTEEALVSGGKFMVGKVDGGVSAIRTAFNAIMKTDGIQLRNSFSFERYLHPEGSNGYDIEVWLPIE
ncbi:GyrI-like domain-containing protein [Sporosarcina sp. JAI121]|uniref:GyrI-like domain-containing protein n=1 Tax=Sporosarcina sp. JAI121 TaxID=2723064 RepID=UPI0015C7A4FC|nr:GyrI-like domain-containing protein [Sporosarcina sp. JAI121]NYF25833.1 putative transcriptional regulator YdeE [Sporosarcina sp. JAI121]